MDSRDSKIRRLQDAFKHQPVETVIEMDAIGQHVPPTNVFDVAPELMLTAEPLRAPSPVEADDTEIEMPQEMFAIRPTVEAPTPGRQRLQTVALLWMFTMANISSNARNPLIDQPWRGLLDAAVVNPNRELGIALSYLFTSDINDIAERLRLEGCGHAGLGILANIGKILAANVPVMAYGVFQGWLLEHFKIQTEQNPVLRVLTAPYLSRIFTAIIATVIYTLARKLVNWRFPVPAFKFNQTPPLHWAQRVAGFGFRIYNATTEAEFYRITISQFSTAPLHLRDFPLIAPMIDQFNVNVIQRLALNYHPYNDTYPFATDDALIPAPVQQTEPGRTTSPTLAVYAESSGNVYSLTHKRADCGNVKSVLWYSTRVGFVLAIGYTTNLIGSLLIQDKEQINQDQLRMTYVALVVLASASSERFFENVIPWLYHKASGAVSSCWSSLYSRARAQAAQVVEDEEEEDYEINLSNSM